jgi:catechol-2,3-dioxygenase
MNKYDVKGLIPWLYYKDLEKAANFYVEIMGFQLEADQGWAKIYKIRDGSFIGLVDGAKGYHKPNITKPVIICLNVYNADAWYEKLINLGIETEGKPKESDRLKIKAFMFKDPEGYVIEIQESLPGALSI